MRQWSRILVIGMAFAGQARAWEKGAVAMPGNPGQSCAMQETGQVGVSFNNVLVAKLDRIGAELDQKIDEIFARVVKEGLAYGSGPFSSEDMQINHWNGGRGVYFRDPSGHLLELLTRDYTPDMFDAG